jgi:hypothetical protein
LVEVKVLLKVRQMEEGKVPGKGKCLDVPMVIGRVKDLGKEKVALMAFLLAEVMVCL